MYHIVEYLDGKIRNRFFKENIEDAKKMIEYFRKIDINAGMEGRFKYKIKKKGK